MIVALMGYGHLVVLLFVAKGLEPTVTKSASRHLNGKAVFSGISLGIELPEKEGNPHFLSLLLHKPCITVGLFTPQPEIAVSHSAPNPGVV